MNFKEVFQLAESKGYKLYNDVSEYEQFIYDNTLCTIELTLIQQWLRNTHNLDLNPKKMWRWSSAAANRQETFYQCSVCNFNLERGKEGLYISNLPFKSYEEALLDGIYAALNLLP